MATKTKRRTITCHCDAYPFPHRWTGGKCAAPRPVMFANTNQDYFSWIEDEYKLRLLLRDGPEFEYDDYLDALA